MSDELNHLYQLLATAKENLRMVEEAVAEYVMAEDVPMQLRKNEARLKQHIAELQSMSLIIEISDRSRTHTT